MLPIEMQFTYHVVNIKQDKEKDKNKKTSEFTYHVVNIKPHFPFSFTLVLFDLHIT